MTVFISWSGAESKHVARAIKKWLPKIIQGLDTFMSEEDIPPGIRWFSDIAAQLEKSNYGIICVTPSNQESPWLNFEAGAIGKETNGTHVTPFAISLSREQISGPLSGFNSVNSDYRGFVNLVRSVNTSLPNSAPEEDVLDAAEAFWPSFEQDLNSRPLDGVPAPKFNSEESILEIRETVRQLLRDQSERRAESTGDLERGKWVTESMGSANADSWSGIRSLDSASMIRRLDQLWALADGQNKETNFLDSYLDELRRRSETGDRLAIGYLAVHSRKSWSGD